MTPEAGALDDRFPAATGPADPLRVGVVEFYHRCLAFGSGEIRRIGELTTSSDGGAVFFVGESFGAAPDFAVESALFRLRPDRIERVRDGPVTSPRVSPDGERLACVSSDADGDVLEVMSAATLATDWTRRFTGRVEDLAWSPDGRRLLVRVAGLGADQGGRDGGTMPLQGGESRASAIVSPSDADHLWRRLWIVEQQGTGRCVSAPGETLWEAAWCGNDAVAVVRSSHHSENAWYDADLALLSLDDGAATVPLYQPHDQIGLPACSPDGRRIAFVEAVCSDRGLVCGELRVIDRASGGVHSPDVAGVDVSSLAFRDDGRIHFAGLRSLETVVGDLEPGGVPVELWVTEDETCGPWHPGSLPIGRDRALVVREGPRRAPELAMLGTDGPETLFATGADCDTVAAGVSTTAMSWHAADGERIDGLLLTPAGAQGPFPTILDVHGGPVLAHRPKWLANVRLAWLVLNGYAVLQPNPRGSCGRGRAFAAAVKGDMGGRDAGDCLAGLDHVVAAGLADPSRLAVSGSSYGGYMAAWLPTQTSRLRAAIAISPITNWRSQHGTSQIARFDALFLPDPALREARSPVAVAHLAQTPTLLLAGLLDRNTPPGQAQEFHTALLEAGVPTQLVLYPHGGHSLRDVPIMFDVSERTYAWLSRSGC